MSRRLHTPVFLQKASYRQRRVRDAARLVPLLGAVLLTMPLTWQSDRTNASALVYIFGAWLALIMLSALLSSLLRPDVPPAEQDPSEQ